ncbi:MAG: preprotein translocase subunit SecG [Ruminococcaceae bacterium]|nr:preprotein translocase subunit SecG [Oscillospiraceae bacterium]
MDMLMTILGIILLVAAVFLVVAVLMQSSKSHKLSGTIAGGAETFFGKSKGATIDKKLNTLTAIVAIIFVVLVAVMYIIQPNTEIEFVDPSVTDAVVDTSADTVVESDSEVVSDEVVESAEAVEDTEAAAE